MFSISRTPVTGYCHNTQCCNFNIPTNVSKRNNCDMDLKCYCVKCENVLSIYKLKEEELKKMYPKNMILTKDKIRQMVNYSEGLKENVVYAKEYPIGIKITKKESVLLNKKCLLFSNRLYYKEENVFQHPNIIYNDIYWGLMYITSKNLDFDTGVCFNQNGFNQMVKDFDFDTDSGCWSSNKYPKSYPCLVQLWKHSEAGWGFLSFKYDVDVAKLDSIIKD